MRTHVQLSLKCFNFSLNVLLILGLYELASHKLVLTRGKMRETAGKWQKKFCVPSEQRLHKWSEGESFLSPLNSLNNAFIYLLCLIHTKTLQQNIKLLFYRGLCVVLFLGWVNSCSVVWVWPATRQPVETPDRYHTDRIIVWIFSFNSWQESEYSDFSKCQTIPSNQCPFSLVEFTNQ